MPTSDTNNSDLSTPSSLTGESTSLEQNDNQPLNMISLNFRTPLAGDARVQRLNGMKKEHPAMPKMRHVQEILHRVQTSLRRIPGICANEAQQMVSDLQEVGQLVSTETGCMLDCIVNLQLDAEFSSHDFARMSVDSTLQKAALDNANERVKELKKEFEELKEQSENERLKLEKEKEELQNDFKMMSGEFAQFRDKVQQSSGSPNSRDELVKSLEDLIQHLEDQVNNRRSLWILRHNDPDMIAKAFNTMCDSIQDKTKLQQSLGHLTITDGSKNVALTRPNGMNTINGQRTPTGPANSPFAHQTDFNHLPPRAPSAFQQPDTPQSARFAPLQAGPPRAPSTRPNGRHLSAWAANDQPNRAMSVSRGLASPGFNRPMSRRGYQTQRYHSGDRYGGSAFAENTPSRPGTSYGFRDQHPGHVQTIAHTRGRGRPSIHNAFEPPVNGNELATRGVNGTPLIHLTERAVAGWSERMDELYAYIRRFVDGHASETFDAEPHGLENTRTWPVLVACYSPLLEHEAASFMEHHLRDYNSKKCLVTRLVIDYIVNCVWSISAWKGFDPETDQAIDQLYADLTRTEGQPSNMRQPLLDRQSTILDNILKHPQPLADFRNRSISHIATALLNNLEPVLDSDVNPGNAWNALYLVGEKAWELSSRILSSRLTFDFRFPEVGARFGCQSMVPVWPADTDPMELQAKHWRVALVTTPVVTCRNDTGTNISAHSVCLADVICMQ